jgi:hypothetical protein
MDVVRQIDQMRHRRSRWPGCGDAVRGYHGVAGGAGPWMRFSSSTRSSGSTRASHRRWPGRGDAVRGRHGFAGGAGPWMWCGRSTRCATAAAGGLDAMTRCGATTASLVVPAHGCGSAVRPDRAVQPGRATAAGLDAVTRCGAATASLVVLAHRCGAADRPDALPGCGGLDAMTRCGATMASLVVPAHGCGAADRPDALPPQPVAWTGNAVRGHHGVAGRACPRMWCGRSTRWATAAAGGLGVVMRCGATTASLVVPAHGCGAADRPDALPGCGGAGHGDDVHRPAWLSCWSARASGPLHRAAVALATAMMFTGLRGYRAGHPALAGRCTACWRRCPSAIPVVTPARIVPATRRRQAAAPPAGGAAHRRYRWSPRPGSCRPRGVGKPLRRLLAALPIGDTGGHPGQDRAGHAASANRCPAYWRRCPSAIPMVTPARMLRLPLRVVVEIAPVNNRMVSGSLAHRRSAGRLHANLWEGRTLMPPPRLGRLHRPLAVMVASVLGHDQRAAQFHAQAAPDNSATRSEDSVVPAALEVRPGVEPGSTDLQSGRSPLSQRTPIGPSI